jgi:hypothetical protein
MLIDWTGSGLALQVNSCRFGNSTVGNLSIEMMTVASDLVKGPISASIIRNPHDKRNVTSKPRMWLRTDDT